MGLRRFFKNRYRDMTIHRTGVIAYEGLRVPAQRLGMNYDIRQILWQGDYERPEIEGVMRMVRPGDRILELGCGLGIVTAIAARQAGPDGRVKSFEANPELIAATRAFLDQHGCDNVELVHAVLVPEAEATTRSFYLAGSFAESSLLGAEGRQQRGQVTVPAMPLGTVIETFRPDVLICDIEGAEAELIPAFDASGLRAAVIELHPDRIFPDQIAGIEAALARHGLRPVSPSPGGTVVIYDRLS